MIKNIFSFLVLFTVIEIFAQNNYLRIPTIPSPASQQMIKYIDSPVSYSTGVPNITIPLHNVPKAGINMDLNLTYHAKGIKVNEISSSFGLGWNLNGLGEIIRTVRGLRDEDGNGFIYTSRKVSSANVSNLPSAYNQVYGTWLHDYQPDLFSITLPNGKNIQFMFAQDLQNNTQNIVTYPLSDIKIVSPFGSTENYWKVIDVDGTTYYFGENNSNDWHISKYYNYNPQTNSLPAEDLLPSIDIITSWKLTKIKTVTNQVINIKYRSEQFTESNHCYNNTMSAQIQMVGISNLPHSEIKNYSLTGLIGANSIIDQIEYDNIRIKFSAGPLREDLTYSKEINSIDIYVNNLLEKQVVLQYSYFHSTDNVVPMMYGCGTGLNMDELGKRLKLNEVIYKDKNQSKINSYKLEYNTEINLPNRNSFAQDYWGYYNGVSSNRSLIPSMSITGSTLNTWGIPLSNFYMNSADRSVNPAFTQANMLKKVIYPTGGHSTYEYENNTTAYQTDSLDAAIIDASYISYYKASASVFNTMQHVSPYYIFKQDLTLGNDIVNIDLVSRAGNCQPTDANGNINIDCSRWNIWNKNSQSYVYAMDRLLGFTSFNFTDISAGSYEIHLKIKEQEYEDIINNNLPLPDWSVEFEIRKQKDPNNYHFGGLRIKEIKKYDHSNELQLKKTFSYNYFSINTQSSGHYYSYPNHKELKDATFAAYMRSANLPCSLTGVIDGVVIDFSSTSFFPLLDYGNYLTYTNVREKEVDYIKNQEIEHKYTYNFVPPFYHFPAEPQTRHWESGLLQEYNSPGIRKLQAHTNRGGGFTKSIRGLDTGSLNFYIKWIATTLPSINCPDSPILVETKSRNSVGGHYELISTFNFLQKEEIIKDGITEGTKYSYDNFAHHQLTEKMTYHSAQSPEITSTSYYYPDEMGNTYLKSKNIMTPLKTVVKNKLDSTDIGKVIKETVVLYADSQAEANIKSAGLPLPYEVRLKSIETNDYFVDSRFTKYDPTNGNLLEYRTKDDVPVTLVWGYGNTLPIAKIEGATYAQVQNYISDVASDSDLDHLHANTATEDQLLNSLDSFRKNSALANFQITTYTYDPLVGVTSITTPSGIREIYVYDAAHRLQQIHQSSRTGPILKKFKYNYKQ